MNINYKKEFAECGVYFNFIDGYTLETELGGARICICAGKNNTDGNCDLLVSRFAEDKITTKNAVYFGPKTYVNSVYRYGAFTYRVQNGEINLCRF